MGKLGRSATNENCHSAPAGDNANRTTDDRDTTGSHRSRSQSNSTVRGPPNSNPTSEFDDESTSNHHWTTDADHDQSSRTGRHKRSADANPSCARSGKSGSRKCADYESQHEQHRSSLRQCCERESAHG